MTYYHLISIPWENTVCMKINVFIWCSWWNHDILFCLLACLDHKWWTSGSLSDQHHWLKVKYRISLESRHMWTQLKQLRWHQEFLKPTNLEKKGISSRIYIFAVFLSWFCPGQFERSWILYGGQTGFGLQRSMKLNSIKREPFSSCQQIQHEVKNNL